MYYARAFSCRAIFGVREEILVFQRNIHLWLVLFVKQDGKAKITCTEPLRQSVRDLPMFRGSFCLANIALQPRNITKPTQDF